MTRYVLMPPDSSKPEIIYRSIPQFAKAKGFRKQTVYSAVRSKGKHTSELGTLWPVEMPDANHNRPGSEKLAKRE